MGPIVTLAIKDLRRSVRSLFLMGMGLGAPLAISAIIALGFASASGDGFEPIKAALVDERASAADRATWRAMASDASLARLLSFTEVSSMEEARALFDDDAVEVVIFLGAAEGGKPPVSLFTDPTATVRPQIVEAVLDRLLDVQQGAAIAVLGAPVEDAPRQVGAYYQWLGATMTAEGARGGVRLLPPDPDKKARGALDTIKARVMLAQLVFFAFFAAAFAAQTILREEEDGTWARLRTTRQRLAVLLTGSAGITATLLGVPAQGTISVNVVDADEPAGPAPAPDELEANVISLYSDAYTMNTHGLEGISAPWDIVSASEVTLGPGEVAIRYDDLYFAGLEFFRNEGSLDASSMTHLHLDVWNLNSTALRIELVDLTDNNPTALDDVTLVPAELGMGEWRGIDIPLSSFESIPDFSSLDQMVIDSVNDGALIFVDNIYFFHP